MAKFRQGNLVLTSDQTIVQGSDTLIYANGVASFSVLGVSGLSTLASLKLTSGATITEISTDTSLGGDSDSVVPTEKAVKTYIDAQVGGAVPPGIDNRIVTYDGTASVQASIVSIDDLGNITGVNSIDVSGASTVNSITLSSGATILEFSTDGNLSGNSDSVVPTEKAVKTYVDALKTYTDNKFDTTIPAGIDNRVVTYDGTSALQASSVVVDDLGNITGVQSLSLSTGASVNEFSTDVTLSGDSDIAVPTEKAVKTYVDAQVGSTVPPGTDESVVRYDGTTSVQTSLLSIDDSGNLSGVNDLSLNGDVYIDGTTLVINYGESVGVLQASVTKFEIRTNSGKVGLVINDGGSVEIYHNNSKVAETTANGITGAVWG